MREKILLQYQQEIPYSCQVFSKRHQLVLLPASLTTLLGLNARCLCQVNVVKYAARKVGKDFIEIEILIERESQKVILLGKVGCTITVLITSTTIARSEAKSGWSVIMPGWQCNQVASHSSQAGH